MGAQAVMATFPMPLVTAASGNALYQRVTVTNAAAVTLSSLLSGGVAPTLTNPRVKAGDAGSTYEIGYVCLTADTDPSAGVYVRYTADGQTAPTDTLGFIVPGGLTGSFVQVPVHPDNIKVHCVGGASMTLQVYLGIFGTK